MLLLKGCVLLLLLIVVQAYRPLYSKLPVGYSVQREHLSSKAQLGCTTGKHNLIYTPVKPLISFARTMSHTVDIDRKRSSQQLDQKILPYPVQLASNVHNFFTSQLSMLQFLWPADNLKLRFFLLLSLVSMFLGKWVNTKVPFILQQAVDKIRVPSGTAASVEACPTELLSTVATGICLYGVAKALVVVCDEAKTCLFNYVSQNVLRKFAGNIFHHLHTLDSDFHLKTPSGVLSVAYLRSVKGFQNLMFQLIFSVAPTLLELVLVANVLNKRFSPVFAGITVATFASYLLFTIYVTQWRVRLRRELVVVDNARNGFLIDSLLNHEVVKLFNNEKLEEKRFDGYLGKLQQLSIDSTLAIGLLNLGQAVLFCTGLSASLLVALQQVQQGRMSVGDMVAVNALLLQLAIPFDFIGYTCKIMFCFPDSFFVCLFVLF
jgi:ABC-type multidrug transport system fused ATPase/permease subunit